MSQDEYLYRIVSYSRVLDLFNSQELHLVRPSEWDDPFEMLLQHKRTHALFAQCWCRRSVSDAMWRVYSPDRQSVRLRTTREKLLTLQEDVIRLGFDCWVKDVEYKTPTQVRVALLYLAQNLRERYWVEDAVKALFIKRDSFDYENEVRFLVHQKQGSAMESCSRSLRIRVQPHSLIESIMFDPRVDQSFYHLSKLQLENEIRFRGSIGKSALYRPVKPIIVGDD